ncbi:MAG: UDP-N-acetylglucosamine 4,6-dehydratase family protein [Solirubrobacterales bacterium]
MDSIKGKNILVIGGTGTIGKTLVQKLLDMDPAVIRVFSRDEHKQFVMQSELSIQGKMAGQPSYSMGKVRFLLGDVRDMDRLRRAMEDIDVVFDLAALKHVPACEYNPFEAVKTNVIGTQNVIECAIESGVSAVLYSSSDKAAGPTNTMGATKLLAERLIAAADLHKGPRNIKFLSVRFGNVLNSRGSVIPLFKKQILAGGPVTVTDPEMTRFVMNAGRAADLMLKALEVSFGGETFVFKMPIVKIGDVAKVMIDIMGKEVPIKVIGLRPGEKMFEELLTEDESNRTVEMEDMFVVLPFECDMVQWMAAKQDVKKASIGKYTSQEGEALAPAGVKSLLCVECMQQ